MREGIQKAAYYPDWTHSGLPSRDIELKEGKSPSGPAFIVSSYIPCLSDRPWRFL